MKLTREFYIKKGAAKVTHKGSDAVAYIYTNGKGKPCAQVFYGRQAKPVLHCRFRDEADRQTHVASYFARRAKWQESKCARRAERNQPHSIEVGHVFYSMWGYEQTNINFYQVTAIIGKTMVEVREVGQIRKDGEAWATGTCVPYMDHFVGEPMRRKVNGASKSIRVNSSEHCRLWDGKPLNWTAYH